MTIGTGLDIDSADFIHGINTASSEASSATPTINTDLHTGHILTAQAVDITSMSSGLSGSPISGQRLDIKINPVSRGNPTFVNSSSATNSAATVTINKPTGTVDGDIMYAVICSDNQNDGWTPPSGWIKLAFNGSSTDGVSLYYKIASSEGSSYIWTYYTSANLYGIIYTMRGGFNPSNPIEAYVSNVTYTTNDVNIRGSLSVPKKNSNLIFIARSDQNAHSAPTALGTWTEHYDGTMSGGFYGSLYSFNWSSNGSTGNINVTMNSASTNKQGFIIALNPEIDVTWGASYNEAGAKLPTKIHSNPATISLWYNSITSKWDTIGEYKNVKKFNSGVTTFDTSSATNTITTIAHGLSQTPEKIRIRAIYNDTTITAVSEGVYSTNNNLMNCIYYGSIDGSSGNALNTSSSYVCIIGNTGDYSAYNAAFIMVDPTNIYLIWTKTGSPTGTAYLLWEAE